MQRRTFYTGLLGGAVVSSSGMLLAMSNQAINATGHSYAQARWVSSPSRWRECSKHAATLVAASNRLVAL